MGFLNRQGFASSIQPAVQMISASAATTLTGLQDMKVFVDTTSAPVAITLPAGTRGQSIEVIDSGDNAGSNIITVVSTIDGVTNTTIETDGGSRVFVFNTAWESGGGMERFFTRSAALGRITSKDPDSLAANQLLGGDTGTTYSAVPADFSNAEANVDQGVSGWGNEYVAGADAFNLGNYNTDGTTPYTLTASVNTTGTYAAWKAFDGSISTLDRWQASGSAGDQWIKIDLGTAKTFVSARFYIITSGYNPSGYSYQGSNDDSNWTTLATVSGEAGLTGWTSLKEFSSPSSYRYYRLYTTAYNTSDLVINEIDFREGAIATTTNTFQYRPLTGGASTNFDTATFTAKDDTASNLLDADILIEYSLDGGSTWPGGQRSLNDFKAVGILTGTSFWLRFEMVGAKKLGSTSITTASSYAEMASGSMKLKDQGIITSALLNSTQQTHTLTGASPTQDLNLGAYNNFLIDLNDATVGATLTWSNAIQGQTYYIRVRQGDNGIDINWPASIQTAGGAGVNAITAASNAEDLFIFYFDGLFDIMLLQIQNLS